MGNSAVEIIKKRIEKLSMEDFDLEAWKETTYAVLLKFLAADDPRLNQINQLKVDYGSWALRDATSKYNPIETAKKKGKEVLENVVDELETVNIYSILQRTLSASSYAEVMSATSPEEIQKVLSKEKKVDLSIIISEMMKMDKPETK